MSSPVSPVSGTPAVSWPNVLRPVEVSPVADPKTGGYAEYLPNSSGDLVKVRSGDGVHFEPAGGDIIARLVLKALNQRFDLTSWKKHRPG